jgi:hypothetical protein
MDSCAKKRPRYLRNSLLKNYKTRFYAETRTSVGEAAMHLAVSKKGLASVVFDL